MKLWAFIIMLITTLLAGYLGFVYTEELKMNNYLTKIIEEIGDNSNKYKSQYNNRIYEISFNGMILNKSDILISENNEKIKLEEIITDKKLILRYSDFNCNTCIDEQINKLKEYTDSIGSVNMCIFATYENIEYMRRFKKHNKITLPIYNLPQEISLRLNDIGAPYYFILDSNTMRINNLFVTQKEYPELTNRYFADILEKYFDKK